MANQLAHPTMSEDGPTPRKRSRPLQETPKRAADIQVIDLTLSTPRPTLPTDRRVRSLPEPMDAFQSPSLPELIGVSSSLLWPASTLDPADCTRINAGLANTEHLGDGDESLRQISEVEKSTKRSEKKRATDEKQRAKSEKQRAKDLAQAEKERLRVAASVNKIQISNLRNLAPQMELIVHVSDLNALPEFYALLADSLTSLGSCVTSTAEKVSLPRDDIALLEWNKITNADYDVSTDAFIPCEERRERERYVICWMLGSTLASIPDMDCLINTVKARKPSQRLFFLIQNIEGYYRLRKRRIDRSFRNQVLADNRLPSIRGKPSASTVSDEAFSQLDEAALEDRLLWLQMEMQSLVTCTSDANDTAEWLARMTLDVASIPYKHVQKAGSQGSAAFSRTGSQRSHSTSTIHPSGVPNLATETLARMVQQLRGCTASHARALCAAYPTIHSLFHDWSKCENDGEAQKLLQDLMIEPPTGTRAARRLGPSMSARIWFAFNGQDPSVPPL